MIESGFPGLSLGFWVGLWAPAGTPAPIIDKLNAATNAALGSPEMKASMQRLGVERQPGSPQGFRRLHRRRSAEMGATSSRRAACRSTDRRELPVTASVRSTAAARGWRMRAVR